MKKIIAVLLSIMLAFSVATSAFAVADTTDTTSVSISEVEPSTDAPATETDPPATETDPSTDTDAPTTSPSEDESPSILERIESTILNFIKEMMIIIGDAWDSLIALLNQYS